MSSAPPPTPARRQDISGSKRDESFARNSPQVQVVYIHLFMESINKDLQIIWDEYLQNHPVPI